jgi:hypothetical protein
MPPPLPAKLPENVQFVTTGELVLLLYMPPPEPVPNSSAYILGICPRPWHSMQLDAGGGAS